MRSLSVLTLLAALTLGGCADPTSAGADPSPTPTTPAETPTPTTPDPTPASTATPAGTDRIPAGLDRDLLFAGQQFLRLARGVPGATLPVDTPVMVLLGGDEA